MDIEKCYRTVNGYDAYYYLVFLNNRNGNIKSCYKTTVKNYDTPDSIKIEEEEVPANQISMNVFNSVKFVEVNMFEYKLINTMFEKLK